MKKVHDQSTEKNSTIIWVLLPKAFTSKIWKLQYTKTSHYQVCSYYYKTWMKNSVFTGREGRKKIKILEDIVEDLTTPWIC